MANYKRIFMDGHSYYITVVTHQRNPILLNNINLLRESFQVSKEIYKYTIDAIVILARPFPYDNISKKCGRVSTYC